jgi:steroid delta-isomerase-like uncharacterized protein
MKKLFMVLPLAMILCFIVGCQDKEVIAELEEFRIQAEAEEQNKAIVNRWFEEMNKGNVEIFREMFHPEFVLYSPSNTTKPFSLEETIETVKMNFKAISDYNLSIQELVAKGDKVIVRFIETGTHSGEWLGIPATGNKYEISTISIWHLKDGKVAEYREEADWLGVFLQLGMELKPKEGEK